MIPLTSERLILRKMEGSDAEAFFEQYREPEIGLNAGWEPHKTIEDTLNFLTHYRSDNTFAVTLLSGQVIGSIGLIDDPRRALDRCMMMGYSYGKGFWHQGYATEAGRCVLAHGFRTLNLRVISAYTFDYNHASRHVLEKLGFRYEGTLRSAEERFDGQIFDICCYSILSEEYGVL